MRSNDSADSDHFSMVMSAMQIDSPKDLNVYKKAYVLAMEIFELSKCFPVEERFALTSQIRRSSRSICLNLGEAWAKRRYEAHFISKLTDCDGENGETDSSLDFGRDCGYISPAKHAELASLSAEIVKMLSGMIKKAGSFAIPDRTAADSDLCCKISDFCLLRRIVGISFR